MAIDIHPIHRFYVSAAGIGQAVFTELSGLQVETEVFEIAEGGLNSHVHRIPGRTRVSNLTLKRGMSRSNNFYTWYMDVATGKKIKRQHLSVVMYDVAGKELYRWNFLYAYPIKWVGPQFDASSNAAAIETLEFAHEGLQ
jgi:phage tail-like protein